MKFLVAFALLSLMACFKPESISGAKPESKKSGIVDNELLAGATSSTNWPAEDAFPDQISVRGKADSQLVIRFYDFITPVKVSGEIILFKGGTVPALDSVARTSFHFSENDTLIISESAFLALGDKDSDTIRFSLKIETDTAEGLFLGFLYSKRQKTFVNSPFSIPSLSTVILTQSKYSFKGTVDSSLAHFGPSFTGKSGWCFYIPGTPYFWTAERVKSGDTLTVGQLSTGRYPLRLIRIQAQDAPQRMNLLEVYSIKVTIDSTTQSRGYIIGLGDKIISREISNSDLIRPEAM